MHNSRICLGLAAAAGVSWLIAGGWLMPALCGLLLICAAHRPTCEQMLAACAQVWMRTPWRAALVVVGALVIWQLVGVELALLMAGDVLAYIEVFVAVQLIAARARWTPMKQAAVARVRTALFDLRARLRPRAPRRIRPPRRSPPGRDADDAAGGWAIA